MSIALGSTVLDTALDFSDLKFKRRDAVLQEMVERAQRAGAVRDPDLLRETLALRERAGTAAIGKGIAIVSARSIAVLDARLFAGRAKRGIDWPAPDAQPVTLVLLALSPSEVTEVAHHAFLARVAGAVRLQRQRQRLLEAPTPEAGAALLREGMAA
jgi:PTS system nitrogen regulatory IIA component